jgi:FkbM family methyltransferase
MTSENDRREPINIEVGKHSVLVRGRDGYFLANRNDVYVGRALVRYGEYNRYEADVLKQLCGEGDVVVEVGANVGSHTIGLAKHVGMQGRVLAFEPQHEVFYNLCANVALNELHNVDCIQCALGETAGTLRVPPADYAREGNFGGIALTSGEGLAVPVQRLDDVFAYDRLRLLKIDVEGMELEVLLGAAGTIAAMRPVLYVENDRVDRSYALITHIQDLGYKLWWHTPFLYHPENYFGVAENDYGSTASFNMLCIPAEQAVQIESLREVKDAAEHPLRK